MKNKYMRFIIPFFFMQLILSLFLTPQVLRRYLGGMLGAVVESILLWVAPGRIVYKGLEPLDYKLEIIMIILVGNLLGILIVATPMYFLFTKKK